MRINLIKLCVPYIPPFLVHLTNSILLEGKYPTRWKTFIVTPTPKSKEVP